MLLLLNHGTIYDEIASGGATSSGAAGGVHVAHNHDVEFGTAQVGGEAFESVTKAAVTPEGGVVAGGEITITMNIVEFVGGGAVVQGFAFGMYVAHNPEVVFGTLEAGGEATVNVVRDVDALGGAVVSGEALRRDPVNHYPNLPQADPESPGGDGVEHNPAVYIGGEPDIAIPERYTEANGGVTIGGVGEFKLNITGYNTSGEVVIGGSADIKGDLVFDHSFTWRVRGVIYTDRTFLWDVGQLRQYWYRLVGIERENKCEPIRVEECCMRFVANVHARTITDLCEILRERKWNWPLESVQRFSRPAENTVVAEDEADGTDHDCNEVEDIDICANPVCAEFCVDADVIINMGWTDAKPQVDAFISYVADSTSGDSLLLGGIAITELFQNPFILPFTSGDDDPDERVVVIGGEALIISSDYQHPAEGGITMGGTAGVGASAYQFGGGSYPYFQEQVVRFAETIDAKPLDEEEVRDWLNEENIFERDGLYALTDVSFNATSNFLVARQFEFDIPDNSNIGLFEVYVRRHATNTDVNDLGVYLIKGTDILSPNLAAGVWPGIPTTSTYSVIADEFTVALPGIPQQPGGWDVDDINDSEFGFAIRVQGDADSSSGTIALVDHVEMFVYYEDAEHQILRMGGQAGVVSSAWSYVASGGVATSGEPRYSHDADMFGIGGATVGGDFRETWDEFGEGGATLSGEAFLQPYIGSGGAVASGEAFLQPYILQGGVSVGGEASRNHQIRHVATGGITLTSDTGAALASFIYEADGGITLGGTAFQVSSAWNWVSDGNAIFIGGEAELVASNFELDGEKWGYQMNIIEIDFLFGTDVETGGLEPTTDTVNVCGCIDVPLTLELSHNLAVDNKLAQFLVRNDLAISRIQQLFYNKTNLLWQKNLHFEGLSADVNTTETWDIIFDLKCTTFVGGFDIDKEVLVFSILVKQKNLVTLEDFDTRVVVGYLPDSACAGSGIDFGTTITYDTQIDFAAVTPDAQIYYSLLYDDLGLFKNAAWTKDSNLFIEISSEPIEELQYRQNMEVVFNS